LRILTKLLIFALLSAVLPICAAFLLTFNTAKNSITQTVEENLLNDAKEQLASLQHRLANSKKELVTQSKLGNMQYVLNGDIDGRLQRDIDIFSSSTPLFTEILATDKWGVIVASNLHQSIGTSLSGTWEFEAPRLGIHFDGPVVQSYRLDKEIATHSVPLFHQVRSEEIIGSMVGSINWDHLQKYLAEHNVFGGKQNSQRQIILESIGSESILYSTVDTEVPFDLLSSATNTEQIRKVAHGEREYMMVSIPSKQVDGFRNPEWRLHVLLDTKIAFAAVDNLKHYFSLAAASVLGLALILGYFLARNIVTPVNSLAISAERIADGDYEHELSGTQTNDEIGQLTNSFNIMRAAVRDNQDELVAKTELAEQAAEAKGEFLANMSHEVRTPINGVLGMTELLMNTPLDDNQSRYANTIFRSGQSLLAVINDILDYSKIEAGKLELTSSSFDLRELVEDVINMLAENAARKGVELILVMEPGSPVAFNGDSARLKQVLLNLLSNAIKFTSIGEVKLLVSFAQAEQSRVPVKFQVIDTGIGIAKESQKQIFDSFVQADGSTTRQFGGTGLGLAISSNLVRLMDGSIGINSELGKGSEFWFQIPLEQLSADVEAIWHNADALAGKRILIVDDTEANREILETQIKYLGAEPVCVAGATEALEQIAQAKQSGQPFDIAILDMHMPVMSGVNLACEIEKAELAVNTKIVLLSSACDNMTLESCPASNITSLVAKPVRQVELFNVLTASIDQSSVPARAHKEVVSEIVADSTHFHILVVEDNPVNQDMMSEMLQILGHSSTVCENGQIAIDALDSDQFDLILMDCQMPVLDGFSATRAIREMNVHSKNNQRIPIVALTANALQGDKEKCLACGMDDYLSKPVSSKQLKSMLHKWLHQYLADKVAQSTPAVPDTEAISGVVATNNSADCLDQQVFNDLLDMCAHAPAGYFEKIVGKFETGSQQDITNIQEAIKANDANTVSASAHRLKSSSLSIGGKSLSSLCQTLEQNAKQDDLHQASKLIDQIETEQQLLLQVLATHSNKAA